MWFPNNEPSHEQSFPNEKLSEEYERPSTSKGGMWIREWRFFSVEVSGVYRVVVTMGRGNGLVNPVTGVRGEWSGGVWS